MSRRARVQRWLRGATVIAASLLLVVAAIGGASSRDLLLLAALTAAAWMTPAAILILLGAGLTSSYLAWTSPALIMAFVAGAVGLALFARPLDLMALYLVGSTILPYLFGAENTWSDTAGTLSLLLLPVLFVMAVRALLLQRADLVAAEPAAAPTGARYDRVVERLQAAGFEVVGGFRHSGRRGVAAIVAEGASEHGAFTPRSSSVYNAVSDGRVIETSSSPALDVPGVLSQRCDIDPMAAVDTHRRLVAHLAAHGVETREVDPVEHAIEVERRTADQIRVAPLAYTLAMLRAAVGGRPKKGHPPPSKRTEAWLSDETPQPDGA